MIKDVWSFTIEGSMNKALFIDAPVMYSYLFHSTTVAFVQSATLERLEWLRELNSFKILSSFKDKNLALLIDVPWLASTRYCPAWRPASTVKCLLLEIVDGN